MPSTPEKLSRLQKVEMGIIPVSELTDEEILKMQVRNDDGTFSKTTQILSNRITQEMRAQFFKRTDDLLRESTLDLLNEMIRQSGPLSWSQGKYAVVLPKAFLDEIETARAES